VGVGSGLGISLIGLDFFELIFREFAFLIDLEL
jgi:hypothetical protein